MHHHRTVGGDDLQHVGRIAGVVDEVLADDLEPVHAPVLRRRAHQMGEVDVAQTDPVAEVGQAEAGLAGRHVEGGKARRKGLALGAGGSSPSFITVL